MHQSFLIILLCALNIASAALRVTVCDPATLEPYPPTDIMVGMNVALVVTSDSNDIWSGGLFLEGDNRDYGTLQGRVKDPNSRNWKGSCLPAAGPGAQVIQWADSIRWGFDFYSDDLQRSTGSCFVLNYQATKPGQCDVLFYNHGISWEIADPNESVVFQNTPTRDFDQNGTVNYADFATFSKHWGQITQNSDPNQNDPNSFDPNLLSPADFNMDQQVDLVDVCMFADFWMYGVAGWQPPGPKKPADSPPAPQPVVSYGICDANSLSEITLTVGQSVTLYLSKSLAQNAIRMFDLEVLISDPNLGTIDNTPIDPNNPDAGTARILAYPRLSFFDYYGPGQIQPEGIGFMAVTFDDPFADGLIASFVYTAQQEGTVVLSLIDYSTLSSRQNLLIHQIIPEVTPASSPVNAASPSTDSEMTAFPNQTADPNELADHLEQIRENNPYLQEQIDESTWNDFVDKVKNDN